MVWGLLGWSLSLVGTDVSRAESELNFPRLANEPGTITGVAFVNPNGEDAPLRLTAYGAGGAMLQGPGINNPVDLMVPANQQIGMLTSQIFGTGLSANTVGWFRATSPLGGITGFFLFLNDSGTLFDGADLPPLDRKIIFNQIRVDDGYSTELNLINTENLSTRIDLLLIDGDAVLEIDPDATDFTMPPLGAARIDVGDSFNAAGLSDGAYLLVVSDTNVGGFQFVRGPTGDLLGLNARPAAEFLNTIYFPQLAVRGPWLMEIGVVNYSTETVTLILTAFQPDGRPFDSPVVARNQVVRQLTGGASLRENVETMFGFTGSEALSGWVKVESTGQAVNGYVSYGVPAVGSVAAVSAVSQAQRRAIFSHIATTLGFFTGVAGLNPSATTANVRFVALTAAGAVLGSTDRILAPGQRISQLITQLIPESANQAGGVIWVSSDVPIYLTSLFGTNTGSVLANIPPQPAPDGYQPDAGIARLALDPRFAVLRESETLQFQAEGAAGDPTWEVTGNLTAPPSLGTVDPGGLYAAPDDLSSSGSVTVAARLSGREAGATVDLLAGSALAAGLDDVGSLAYLEGTGRLFAVVASVAGASGAGPQGAAAERDTLIEITAQGPLTVVSVAGEDLRGLEPFEAFDGSEYLLATGGASGRLLRIDPGNGQLREVLTGLDQPGPLAHDPLSGAYLIGDAAGVTRLSRVLVESDLVSGLQENGSPPARIIQRADIGGLAVNGCTGAVYYSDTAAGEIWEFTPADGSSRQVRAELLAPASLLGLQRANSACQSSFHLLVAESGADRLVLIDPAAPEPLAWFDTSDLAGLAFLPAGNPHLNSEAVLFSGSSGGTPAGAGAAVAVTAVTVPDLYQQGAVNSPGAPAGLLADPALDTFNFFEGLVHDIVELAAESDETNLNIRVSFSDTISPCEQSDLADICDGDENPIDAVAGFIDLDLDQNASTGLVSFTEPNSPYSSRLGAELCVDFFRYNTAAGGVEIYRVEEEQYVLLARVPVEFGPYDLSFSIPLSLLEDDGQVNLAAVFGTTFPQLLSLGPTDAVPNGGFLQSAASAQQATAVAAQRGVSKHLAGKIRARAARYPGAWKRLLARP